MNGIILTILIIENLLLVVALIIYLYRACQKCNKIKEITQIFQEFCEKCEKESKKKIKEQLDLF